MEYHMEPFDIGQLLQECVDSLQQTTQSHRLYITETVQQSCVADRLRVEQVIVNLLSNAIKYSPDSAEVQVGLRLQQNELLISVRDFGIGISPENQVQLFQRFYRVANAAGRFQGLGIGLFLSKEIVERHQGRIWPKAAKTLARCLSLRCHW